MVMEDGKIVDKRAQYELSQRDGLYATLATLHSTEYPA